MSSRLPPDQCTPLDSAASWNGVYAVELIDRLYAASSSVSTSPSTCRKPDSVVRHTLADGKRKRRSTIEAVDARAAKGGTRQVQAAEGKPRRQLALR